MAASGCGDLIDCSSLWAIFHCLILAFSYVGSLYVWKTKENRDHPDTIKKRFLSVVIISCIAPVYLFVFALPWYPQVFQKHSLFEWLGFRWHGLMQAFILPLFLTMVLFAGSLLLHFLDGVVLLYLDSRYWRANLRNVTWLRNHVVAPFSEEFIFRACMLPLLVNSIGSGPAVFVAPLFFGIAHFHHTWEKHYVLGVPWKNAISSTAFQFCYTTVFGAYSAFLFLRTGHLMAPFIAHSFCNHMGFPDFGEALAYRQPIKSFLAAAFAVGLLCWCLMLYPLSEPKYFHNNVYSL